MAIPGPSIAYDELWASTSSRSAPQHGTRDRRAAQIDVGDFCAGLLSRAGDSEALQIAPCQPLVFLAKVAANNLNRIIRNGRLQAKGILD